MQHNQDKNLPLSSTIQFNAPSTAALIDDVQERYNIDGVITMPNSASSAALDADYDDNGNEIPSCKAHADNRKGKISACSSSSSSSSSTSSDEDDVMCGWDCSLCCSTCFVRPIVETIGLVRRRHRARVEDGSLTKADYIKFSLFLIAFAATNAMQFFGQNFWLSSFGSKKGATATYVSLVIPSLLWAVFSLLLMVPFKLWYRPDTPLFFWRHSREAVVLLVLIGVADAFAGLTSVYAVPHIPPLMQTTFYASGTIWVYIFHRIAYAQTAMPFSTLLFICFLFLVGGVALSIVPVVRGHSSLSAEPGWIGIFLLSILLPALYNACQGRFLGLFSMGGSNSGTATTTTTADVSSTNGTANSQPLLAPPSQQQRVIVQKDDEGGDMSTRCVPRDACKLIVLTGDYCVQALVTLAFLPLDAMPWFGASDSVGGAWDGFTAACECIWWECLEEDHNFYYMLLYVFGFWGNRLLATFMNMYSPTAAALVGQATNPVVSLLLAAVPSWNINGTHISVGYTLGCFGALVASAALFIVVNEAHLQRKAEEKQQQEEAANPASSSSPKPHGVHVFQAANIPCADGTSQFVPCKDYDDDATSLQTRISDASDQPKIVQ